VWTGTSSSGFAALGSLVFSLPAGFIGLGERRTTIGLMVIAALLALLMHLPAALSVERLIVAIQAVFPLPGFARNLLSSINSPASSKGCSSRSAPRYRYIISNSKGTFLGFGPSGVNTMPHESISGLPMMRSTPFLRFSATSNTAPPGTLTP